MLQAFSFFVAWDWVYTTVLPNALITLLVLIYCKEKRDIELFLWVFIIASVGLGYEAVYRYVAGDVVDPGQKIFPRPVNVVEALAAAGWFEETADLTNARIIRTRGKQKEIIPVDNTIRLFVGILFKKSLLGTRILLDRLMIIEMV